MMFVEDLHSALVPYLSGEVYVVTDERAAEYCLPLLGTTGVPTLVLPCGEQNKNIVSVEKIWDFLLQHHATRRAVVLNIGGGVVTDMGGFAAATYKRGVRFVNIPTTLLAMVDASTGGKTGINYGGIKNAIGTFSAPEDTLLYMPFLETLPAQEWLSGFAEMLKHALLQDKKMWNALLTYDIDRRPITPIRTILADSLHVKQDIVAQDPHEQGLRKALNFGHTVGHAIEEMYAQQGLPVPHGYCVLWGMVAELYLSVALLAFPREPLTQMVDLMLHYYGRPQCNCKQQEQLLTLMQQDKKNTHAGVVSFTLLKDIGIPVLDQTPSEDLIKEALDYLFSL